MNIFQKTGLLGLITARGGSKGLPRKNLLPAGGRPLIAWTIAAALRSRAVDHLVMSSDDEEIMEVAEKWGCSVPFRRPAELATDAASSMDVVMHALDQLPSYEYVALLQPTSPLRTAGDIDAAFETLLSSGAPSCVSVCETEESPYWMYGLSPNARLIKLLDSPASRRQDLPRTYVLNGAIYIANVEWLRDTRSFVGAESVAYIMPNERSIDIDTAADFEAFCQKICGENAEEETNGN
jgi:N-acylneuraminate cytidylyltransferase